MDPLPFEAIDRRCDPALLPVETTAELPDLLEAFGQDRAVEAINFGMGMRHDGYNLFVMGPTEAGKRTIVREFLGRRAAGEPAPADACYVHDFEQPHRPRALVLPAGQGTRLRRDLEDLVRELRLAIPAAFESDEQRDRKQAIEDEVKERHDRAMEALRAKARDKGIALLHAPMGFIFAPLSAGAVIEPDEFEKLPKEEQERLQGEIEGLQGELHDLVATFHDWAHEAREKMRKLLNEIAAAAVRPLVDRLRKSHEGHAGIASHLDAVERAVLENVGDFASAGEGAEPGTAALTDPSTVAGPSPFRRYLVNLLVDSSTASGAPVVEEDNPTIQDLLGRVEHLAHMGALLTDFHLIKAGALHRANGGYLLLDARALLTAPFAWDGLKRALRSREIRIHSLGQLLALAQTVTLDPEPIPLDVKVVLLGERQLFYLLSALDPEFQSLFKVVADFEDVVPRTPETTLLHARLVATIARRAGLRALDRAALCRTIEEASRLAADSERLSTHVGSLVDLLREADDQARRGGRSVVGEADVEAAIEASFRRVGRLRDRVLDAVGRGTILIETDGERVGQVNGLSVVEAGPLLFGRPTRITARVRLGDGEVIDIEREAELGGPIHSKGVLILAGFLGSRYAVDHPLSLSATLVFEQSYGQVEGDSASLAELHALLSALAEVPLSQSVAMTGSVNQHGQVQPVGGINEKVEGFFEACRIRGLTGRQGVIIPRSNVPHLVLRRDAREAIRGGTFRIWAIETVDEGLEILTGLPAGVRDSAGRFTPGSVNARVDERLRGLALRRWALARQDRPHGIPAP